MFGSKLPGSGELTYGDQEKDANSLLMELDKGLRSTKPGEQCEAIVRFPRLFEKYPFPILINSAFLKLADLFRVGSNFLRQCIHKVTQQSHKHLNKILNVDEFLRRIFSVIHSNDPIARAITLRTLGQAAHIIANRKNVHHSILSGLDSHDAVEQEAAIFAASCFAAESKSFSSNICTKLEEMIEGLSTAVGMKLRLIPIFQHMHHEADTARKVMSLCTSTLLPCYPSKAFVQVTLHTMSLLAARSLMDIPRQVDLLLQYLVTDCRKSVKIVALKDLKLLADKSPHMWTDKHIQTLCEVGLGTPYTGLKVGVLRVLTCLSGSVAVESFSTQQDDVVMEFCTQSCYESHLLVASYGAQLYTHLATHKAKESPGSPMVEECATILDMLSTLTSDEVKHADTARQMCMRSIVELCTVCPSQTDRFVDALISSLAAGEGSERLALCHCLAALGSNHGDLMSSLASDLLTTLQSVITGTLLKEDKDIVVSVVVLLFQSSVADGLPDQAVSGVLAALDRVDQWTAYKIARQATRYGHHRLSNNIYKTLLNQVSSEHNNFWLTALAECSQGDTCLHGDDDDDVAVTQFVRRVSQAEIHYHNAVSALKAASTPASSLEFQTSYLTLQADLLQVVTQVIQVCCSFQTSPPPAIATSLAMTNGQDFYRCRHVITQMKKCRKSAEDLREAYNTLYKSSFDADVASLTNLQMSQEVCHLLIHVLETMFILCRRETSSSSLEGLPVWKASNKKLPLEFYKWGQIRNQVLEIVSKTIPTPSQATLTHYHVECIKQTAMLICSNPLCLPRYFYQKLQSTDVKLALSPQPRSQNEPITVHYDTCLTLKVEGVIQHGHSAGRQRQIHSVHLSVVSAQQSKSQTLTDEKAQENPTNDMTQSSEPKNDYFSSHFLLSFPVPGLHTVTLRTSVQDETGATWTMGSPVTLMVKSYDEAVQRQQQQQYAAQRHQQRAALVSSITAAS